MSFLAFDGVMRHQNRISGTIVAAELVLQPGIHVSPFWASVPAPTFDSRCNALQIKCRRLRNTSKPMILV
ncbi:MAG: hypothetical protein CTY20_15380, partial [Hyphomicrobium sp.]